MMLHKLPILTLAACLLFQINAAAIDWQPEHKDKPVGAEHKDALEGALPDQPIAQPKAERKVLVFSATQKFRHQSIPLGKLALIRLGEKTGAYEAVVSDDPANFEVDTLEQFDAVILLSPTGDFFMPNPKQKDRFSESEWTQLEDRHKRLVNNLIEFVKAGGGLMGIHSATDACYGHQEYGTTIGGYFAGHPWNWNNNVTIVVEDPEHPSIQPVFSGRDYFELVEEIYKYRETPNPRTNNHVLLSLDPKRSDRVDGVDVDTIDIPVAWVNSVGKGRVFYTSIGHNNHIYTNPLMLRHYLAGIQYAVGDLHETTESQ